MPTWTLCWQRCACCSEGRLRLDLTLDVKSSALHFHQPVIFRHQLDGVFLVRRVTWNAIHRAHLLALRFVVVADAFGALVRVDHVDVDTHRDSVVRALGLAYVAVDALLGNEQGHALLSSSGISPAFLVPARPGKSAR